MVFKALTTDAPMVLLFFPWRDGRRDTWEVTVSDTVAPSYLSISSACSASAAEAAAKRKDDKYTEIACNYHFFPIAFETFGPIGLERTISALGHRISSITDVPRKTLFLHPFCCDVKV